MTDRDLTRRRFAVRLARWSAVGPAALAACVSADGEDGAVTLEQVRAAEKMAGLEFTDEERRLLLEDAGETLSAFEQLRGFEIDNSVPPALHFNPVLAGMRFEAEQRPVVWNRPQGAERPENLEQAAFWPVTRLAELIRSRQVTSVELTEMYLGRLKRFGPQLECTVNLTEERALERARAADAEIAAGTYRGPLHGIPWGAKDLLAVRGYPTTWGAAPYRDQVIDADATVVERLDAAGAVLTAKLTMGALAWGDVWFGGRTRNPWDLEQGSSGSSAGSASTTAAGLVGFAIGTETLGSIVSPSTRCGVTGLRPTYGRVSRHGAMALSWSMDKIGPICRSVEDCAIVFDAIHGPDGRDLTLHEVPFNWREGSGVEQLRVGYLEAAFNEEREDAEQWAEFDRRSLEQLRAAGIELVPLELPDIPSGAMEFVLNVEAAAAFDELTRSGKDDLMVRQIRRAWPNVFRHSRLIPAVEYVQANRLRTLLMREMAALMEQIDVYVAPAFVGDNLGATNLTGHPSVVIPNGFSDDGHPTSITFVGRLFGEEQTLAVARRLQDATDFHLQTPPGFSA